MAALVSLGLHIRGCQQRWSAGPRPGVALGVSVDLGYGGDLVGSAALISEFGLRETKSWVGKHLPAEAGFCSPAEWERCH